MPKILPVGALPAADEMHFPCNGPIEVDAGNVVALCATGLAVPYCDEAMALVAAAQPAASQGTNDVLDLAQLSR